MPVNLRSYAKLDVTALIVGVGAKAEIWDVKRYAEYNAKVEKDVVELVEELDFE